MQFSTNVSLLAAFAVAAQAQAPGYISNEGGRSCATRVTDAYGNGGCTLHEIVNGTPIKIIPGTTIVEGSAQTPVTEFQVFGTSTFINGQPVGGSGGSGGQTITGPISGTAQVTNILVIDGTTIVNGQTVGASPASSGSHNAAPVPTRGPSLELAMAAIAAGGFVAAF